MSINYNFKRNWRAEDLDIFLRELQDTTVRLPRYKTMLRARLVAQHAHFKTPHRIATAKTKGVSLKFFVSPKNALALVAPVLAAGLLVGGVLAVQPTPAVHTAQWLAIAASKEVEHMNSEKVAHISEEYHEDIAQCLDDAVKSPSLRILSASQFRAWVGAAIPKEDVHASNTYLTYTDTKHHRIVIALNEDHEPVYVLDVETLTAQLKVGFSISW